MADAYRDPLASRPDHDVVLDAAMLRILAHPMRISLLQYLREAGPATGRMLAQHFSLDSGAVSYHLRKLAAGGLIEEDAERGTRRDRWWRARHEATYHDPLTMAEADERQDSRAFLRAVLLAYSDALRRFTAEVPQLSDEWFDVAMASNQTLRLTPYQLNSLKRELMCVIDRYRDLSREPDSGVVSVHLDLLPVPGL